MSRTLLSLAGFQVILIGRFWVIAEAMLLSNACMQAFESGDAELRSTARCLDYFAYGTGIRDRAATISRALRTVVADQEAGDIEGTPPVE